MKAQVKIDRELVGSISSGLVALVAVGVDDGPEDVRFLSRKILNLRIFPDEKARMNRSLLDARGELLLISQFTLYGDCRKGNRPGYSRAASPERAERLYEELLASLREGGTRVETGRFRAHMQVSLVNDGPVTLLIDSRVPV